MKAEQTSPYYVSFLDTMNGRATVVRVKDFSQSDFDNFVKARDSIDRQVLQYMSLYEMVAIMYDNLVKAYEERADKVKNREGINARTDLTELNAYLAAFIANMGMYLDCVPRMISSKQPKIIDIHKKATNVEYDSSFAYRLFCGLRNYTLHNVPPITGIRGSNNLIKGSANVKAKYEIYIEKKKLMEDSQIAKKLAVDFALPTEQYPVIEYATETVACLKNIHWKTIKALVEPIQKDIAVIEAIAALTAKRQEQPYIASLSHNKDIKGMDVELNLVPTNIIEICSKASKY